MVLDINNPLSTGYVVQASLDKGTVFWLLKKLEDVVHSFLYQGPFLQGIYFLRFETKFNFVVDLKQLSTSAHFNDGPQDWVKRSSLRDAAPVRGVRALL